MRPINVALVENMDRVHKAYTRLLQQLDGVELVAAFYYPEDLIARLDTGFALDAVVMDIRMDEDATVGEDVHMDGIEAACQIRARWPRFPIVLCSIWDNPDYYRRIEAARFRTHYAIVKRDALEIERMGEVLYNVVRGFVYIDDTVRVEMELQRHGHDHSPLRLLETEEQRAVLALISDGLSNDEIARTMKCSTRRVEEIVRHIYELLDLRNEGTGDSRRIRAARMYLEQRVLLWEENPDGSVRVLAQDVRGDWRLLDDVKREVEELRTEAQVKNLKDDDR
jgi:DNA-binding NarL/FixJ family response regulator